MARKPSHLERNWDTLLNSFLDVAHDADGTVRIPADYIVYVDSTVGYRARSMAAGTSYTHATDAASVVQSAITALGAAGGTIVLAGNLAWGSVPALKPNTTGKVTIRGAGNCKVTLSPAGPRFLDFGKVADYDTFSNIEIVDLTIDVNSVGGQHHVVIGTYAGGTSMERINVQNLTVRNVRTTNVPVDPSTTDHRLNVWIAPAMPVGSSPCSLTGIKVQNVRFEGGNAGITVAATGSAGSNCVVDDVLISDWWHSLLSVQSSVFGSSHIQIGSAAQVRRCTVRDGIGFYSADVGIEIDNALDAVVDNVSFEDVFNAAFFFTNFSVPENPNEQTIQFVNCRARRLTAVEGCGFRANIVSSVALGNIVLRNCSWYRNTPDIPTEGDAVDIPANAASISSIIVDGFVSTIENVNFSSGSNFSHPVFWLNLPSAPTVECLLRLKGIASTINGQRSGAGTYSLKHFYITGKIQLDTDDITTDTNISSMATSSTIGFDLGLTTSSIRGTIRRYKVLRSSSDTQPRGIVVRGTSTLTISPGFLTITESDFRALPSSSAEILYVATSNAGSVRVKNNQWRNGNTRPVPTTLTGLVTATGAPLATGWDAIVQFVQGSGAAITAIDISTNNGTTYKNYLTQGSGALPAGFSESIGPLPTDALVKVTFATTQPTINLIPASP